MSSNVEMPSEPLTRDEQEASFRRSGERHRELHETIKGHLLSFGDRNWDRIRDAFPGISSSTFWRQVSIVRVECAARRAVGISQLFSSDLAGALSRLRNVEILWREAETIAESAKRTDGTIRDANILGRSIGTRTKLLGKLVDVSRELRDFEHSTFLEAMVEVLGDESPELSERVIKRMYERFHQAADAA